MAAVPDRRSRIHSPGQLRRDRALRRAKPGRSSLRPAREGGTFLVRDDRQRPHFYMRAAERGRAQRAGRRRCRRRSASGPSTARPYAAIEVEVPARRSAAARPVARRRHRDVRGGRALCPALPHRARHQGRLRDRGRATSGDADRPGVRQSRCCDRRDVRIEPRVLSFDIETDPKGERLLAISLYGRRTSTKC